MSTENSEATQAADRNRQQSARHTAGQGDQRVRGSGGRFDGVLHIEDCCARASHHSVHPRLAVSDSKGAALLSEPDEIVAQHYGTADPAVADSAGGWQ